MNIAVIPIYKSLEKNKLFNADRDFIHEPYVELRNYFIKNRGEKNKFDTIDNFNLKDCDYFLFFRLDWKLWYRLLLMRKLEKTIYIQLEPPIVSWYHNPKVIKCLSKIFGKVLTWNDDLIDNKKIFKFNIPMPNNHYKVDSDKTERKLLCNISGAKFSTDLDELYSKRVEAIKYFEKRCEEDFDLYGVGWNNKEFPSYKGKIKDKNEVLKKYKFSICYENQDNLNGYITEKIFDCFYAKTIPIYWGALNIEDYVPKKCFIDKREYKTYDELYNYITNLKDREYEEKILAIEEFLNSKEYSKFLGKTFSKNLYNVIINEKINFKYRESIINKFIIFNYFKAKRKLLKHYKKFFKK